MGETIIEAPNNPYRHEAGYSVGRYGGLFAEPSPMSLPPVPRRFDTESGPGMTAADIDSIARTHHLAGYAKAEREFEAKLESVRGELATAYDHGYTAGRVERAQGLAREVFSRLFEPQAKLIEVRGRPKREAHAGLDDIEAALVELREFVSALFSPHDAAAGERAAAQVARDEA